MSDLAAQLRKTWTSQAAVGFLLSDPGKAEPEIRQVADHVTGIEYRLRWLPHREIRTDVEQLKRRGIVNPDMNGQPLFYDPRDPDRFCFLCEQNIRQANPMETLLAVQLGGRDYFAGANFAWIAMHHFTVMSARHMDQHFDAHVLDAMLDLHRLTNGEFRVIYNGAQAGTTIPWHLHYQITSEQMPVERLPEAAEELYPTALKRFRGVEAIDETRSHIENWVDLDRKHHRVNLLVAGAPDSPVMYVFPRDTRRSHAKSKGLMGGFEVCGDLVFSDPATRNVFEEAQAELVRSMLQEIRPNRD